MGIVLPDADLQTAVEQITIGSTSYNGQRCTAIKLIFLHASIAESFLAKFKDSISSLKFGLPWEKGVAITPLPEKNKVYVEIVHILFSLATRCSDAMM
jgi:glyceraldehyde-3-phosphate dehydrogenase (NADP+)